MATSADKTSEIKKDQSSTNSDNQKHFWDIIKGFPNVFLLSRAPDGSEHGRPMGFQVKDQAIYFFTEVNSPKVQEIKDDYHITVTGQKSDQWIFAKGTAKVITDKAKIAEHWTETVRPWFPKDIDDSSVSLICLIPQCGEYWDQSSISNKLSFAWDLGKAYVTGQKAQRAGDMDKGGEQHSKVDLAQPARG
jgi:general stress protein 26